MISRIALALSLAAMLFLTGCWDRMEINDLAIISMMAMDRTEEGDIQIWLQVVIPARVGGGMGGTGGGGGGGGGQMHAFITLSSRGRTVLEASKKIQVELPRRLLWAHMRVILVGERLARAGVRPALDFPARHPQVRLNSYFLVVQGSVEEIMAAQVDLEKLPAEYLREISRSRIGPVVKLNEFAQLLAARGVDPIAGVAVLVPPPGGAVAGQRPALKLGGAALFREDRLVEFLDERVTRGLLWLRGEVHRGVITVTVPEAPGFVSVEWVSSNVRRRVWMEGGRIVLYVQAKTEGDITEDTIGLDLSDPRMLVMVNAQLNKAIRERIEAALVRMRELNVDSAGFGEVVHEQLPAVWQRVEKKWLREEFREAKIVIEVDAEVRRTGLSSKPAGVQEEDLLREGR